jgi:hypothetical protein
MNSKEKGGAQKKIIIGAVILAIVIYLGTKFGMPYYDNGRLQTMMLDEVRQGKSNYSESWYQNTISTLANKEFGIPVEPDDINVTLNRGEGNKVEVIVDFEYAVEVSIPKYTKELIFHPKVETIIVVQ